MNAFGLFASGLATDRKKPKGIRIAAIGMKLRAIHFHAPDSAASSTEQGQFANHGRGRQTHVQPVRRHTGEPRQASEREAGVWTGVYRLAGVARRPKVYRQLQD